MRKYVIKIICIYANIRNFAIILCLFSTSFFLCFESTCRTLIPRHKICLYQKKTHRKRVFPLAIQPRITEEGNMRGLWIYSDTLFRWKYCVRVWYNGRRAIPQGRGKGPIP